MNEVISQHVVPTLGVITGTFLSFAPYRAVLKASKDGHLGDLNPTPWVFMLGNCFGWVLYSFMIHNVYIFLPNSVGLILAIWLNIQAIKLQYENYRSKEMQDAIVAALEERQSKTMRRMLNEQDVTEIVEHVLVKEEANLLADIIQPSTTASIHPEEDFRRLRSRTLSNAREADAAAFRPVSPIPSPFMGKFGSIPHADVGSIDSSLGDDLDNDGLTTKFDEATEVIADYAAFIWNITAQNTPAPASHELMMVGICSFWLLLNAIASLGGPLLDINARIFMVGLAVSCNLIFFYGAPLSKIAIVLDTKTSSSIHITTMVTSLMNSFLWLFYGIAVKDGFIAVPNGLGALFGMAQLLLCIIYPRHLRKEASIPRTISTQSLSPSRESTPLV